MLAWIDGRNGSSFDAVDWNAGTLQFTIEVGAGANGLRAMVPTDSEAGPLAGVERNGVAVATTTETIKGVEYAFFAASAGQYAASYETDTTAPAITNVAATAATDGTATVTWTTDEAADSRVEYGTAAGSLTQTATDASAVTSHSVRLTGLTAGTTYFYRVRSADGSNNATTAPATPLTFKTYIGQTPAAAVIETGTLRTGTAAALATSNNTFYEVNSTTVNPRTSSWYGSFTGVTAGSSNLKITYEGRNSRSCTQTLSAWRWSDSTWQQFDSRAVSTADVTINEATPPGAASGYISASGEVRVRVRCTGPTANFYSRGDFMRIVYQRP
jgi:Purple acid Phosphatase, N-terminal domain